MHSKESRLVALHTGRGGRWSDQLRLARLPLMFFIRWLQLPLPSQTPEGHLSGHPSESVDLELTSLLHSSISAGSSCYLHLFPTSSSSFSQQNPPRLETGGREAVQCLRTDRELSGLLHATYPRSLVGAHVARILCSFPSFTS